MSTENELLVTARYAGTSVVARVARERVDESSASRAVTYGDVARAFARRCRGERFRIRETDDESTSLVGLVKRP